MATAFAYLCNQCFVVGFGEFGEFVYSDNSGVHDTDSQISHSHIFNDQ